MPASGDQNSGDCFFALPPPPPPQKYQRQKDQNGHNYKGLHGTDLPTPKDEKRWDSEPRAGKSSEKLLKSCEMFQIF